MSGCERGSVSSVPVSSGPRYLALGDSYTCGEAVDPSERWPVQLVKMLREQKIEIADPEIIATTGWTTDELSAGIDVANPRGPYAMVSLLIGVNNQFRGRSVEEFRSQFAGLLKRAIGFAGGESKRVFVVSIPDWGATPFGQTSGRDPGQVGREIDQFNSVCREECEKAGVAFVDITPISKQAKEDRSLVAEDGLHPSGKMYGLWCGAALPVAEKVLGQ
ncbi:MAG TPA: SGNH/GDSL hydrolase family protein [Tepidisphaeraceae bacterium]|nr:SGNH/GDSL hydrolase family protein [Tepidisphaeraceae bacterium]